MLSDVDVVLLDYIAFEYYVEVAGITAGLGYDLPVKVEFQLAFVVELLGFFIFHVQLVEKCALQQIVDFVPLSHLDVVPQFLNQIAVDWHIDCQNYGFFPADYALVGLTIEGTGHDDCIFLAGDVFLGLPVGNYPCKYNSHEGGRAARVDHIPCFDVHGSYFAEDEVDDYWGQFVEEGVLLQVQTYEVFLIWGSFLFLAYFGDGHQFLLVVLVHEVEKILSFGEPFRVQFLLFVLELAVVKEDCFGIGESGALGADSVPDRGASKGMVPLDSTVEDA